MLCPSLMEERRVEQPSLSTHRELLVVDQPVGGTAASAPSRAFRAMNLAVCPARTAQAGLPVPQIVSVQLPMDGRAGMLGV